MKQNKFPSQPFSKRIIISLTFLYSLGYRSPITDTIQTQTSSLNARIVQFQGPSGAWNSAPCTASLVFWPLMQAERLLLDAFWDHTVNRQDQVSVAIVWFMKLHIKPCRNLRLLRRTWALAYDSWNKPNFVDYYCRCLKHKLFICFLKKQLVVMTLVQFFYLQVTPNQTQTKQ